MFLTGDIHSGWAADLPVDPATYPRTRESVGVELVCTSVTSDNIDDSLGCRPRTRSLSLEHAIQRNNPHVKYVDLDSHGFSVLDVTPERVQMDWYVVIDRLDPQSAAVWSTSWKVDAGSTKVAAGVRPARRALAARYPVGSISSGSRPSSTATWSTTTSRTRSARSSRSCARISSGRR